MVTTKVHRIWHAYGSPPPQSARILHAAWHRANPSQLLGYSTSIRIHFPMAPKSSMGASKIWNGFLTWMKLETLLSAALLQRPISATITDPSYYYTTLIEWGLKTGLTLQQASTATLLPELASLLC